MEMLTAEPETYHPVKLRHKAQRLRKETGNNSWRAPIEIMDKSIPKTILWSCIRPFQLVRAQRNGIKDSHTDMSS